MARRLHEWGQTPCVQVVIRCAIALVAAFLLTAVLAGCASSSSSGDPPGTVPLTDPAQVKLPVEGPLDQFAADAAREIARANALLLRVQKQRATTSGDPAAVGRIHDSYAGISRRFQAICSTAEAQRPNNTGSGVGSAELSAWRIGLQWCGEVVTLWKGATRVLGDAQRGVAPTQAQQDRLTAAQTAVQADGDAFRAAYATYVEQRG
jgi:hypothetical protein